MPNEFIARNGLIALNNTTVSGSFLVSGSVGIGLAVPRTTAEIVGTLRITNTSNSSRFNDLATDLNGFITLGSLVYSGGIGSNNGRVNLFQDYIAIGVNSGYFITSTDNAGAATRDVGISRVSASVLAINNGAAGNSSGLLLATKIGLGLGLITSSAILHISGASSDNLLRIDSPASSSIIYVSGSGVIGFNQTSSLGAQSTFKGILTNTYTTEINTFNNGGYGLRTDGPVKAAGYFFSSAAGGSIQTAGGVFMMSFDSSLNVGIAVSSSIGGRLHIRGAGATSATNTLLLQNATPVTLMTVLDNGQFIYTSPTMSLAASQSAHTISPIISASNLIGGQFYGVNITPTFYQTTASQVETAFRVAATFTQSSTVATSGSNIIADFGATSVGSQFTVTDVTSGSIYMVNDVSGLPIIEATSDWTVNMYNFPNIVFQKTGSNINITGSLRVTGSLVMSPTSSFVFPLSQSVSPLTGSAYWSGSLLFIWDGSRYRSSSFA